MKNQNNKRLYEVIARNAGIPLVASGLITLVADKGVEFLKDVFSADWIDDFLSKTPKVVIFLIAAVAIQRIFLYKNNEKVEFAPSNQYCKFPPFLYKLAFLWGYQRKIDLKLKPIDIQFRLFQLGNVELYDSTELGKSENYNYSVKHINKLNDGNREINVIISDTHDIEFNKIPKISQDNYTIIIDRENKGSRVDSEKIIKLLSIEIEALKDKYKVYNLFLSTPGKTNLDIYNLVFHTVNDDFIIKIYTQDKDCNFAFRNKPLKIKC